MQAFSETCLPGFWNKPSRIIILLFVHVGEGGYAPKHIVNSSPMLYFWVKLEIQNQESCSRSAISKFAKGVTDVFHRDLYPCSEMLHSHFSHHYRATAEAAVVYASHQPLGFISWLTSSPPSQRGLSHSSCGKPHGIVLHGLSHLHMRMGISPTTLELQLKLLSQVIFEIMNITWYEEEKQQMCTWCHSQWLIYSLYKTEANLKNVGKPEASRNHT